MTTLEEGDYVEFKNKKSDAYDGRMGYIVKVNKKSYVIEDEDVDNKDVRIGYDCVKKYEQCEDTDDTLSLPDDDVDVKFIGKNFNATIIQKMYRIRFNKKKKEEEQLQKDIKFIFEGAYQPYHTDEEYINVLEMYMDKKLKTYEEYIEFKKGKVIVEEKKEEVVVEEKKEEVVKDVNYECDICSAFVGGVGDQFCNSLKEYAGSKYVCDLCLKDYCRDTIFKEHYDLIHNMNNIIEKKVKQELAKVGFSIVPDTEKNKEKKKEVLKEKKKNKKVSKFGAVSKKHNPDKDNTDEFNPLQCKCRIWNEWYGGQCSNKKLFGDGMCKSHYNRCIEGEWYYGFMDNAAVNEYPSHLHNELPQCVQKMRHNWIWKKN